MAAALSAALTASAKPISEMCRCARSKELRRGELPLRDAECCSRLELADPLPQGVERIHTLRDREARVGHDRGL
eukprot:5425639-Alexandrium_andersonii.AAC.1